MCNIHNAYVCLDILDKTVLDSQVVVIGCCFDRPGSVNQLNVSWPYARLGSSIQRFYIVGVQPQ